MTSPFVLSHRVTAILAPGAPAALSRTGPPQTRISESCTGRWCSPASRALSTAPTGPHIPDLVVKRKYQRYGTAELGGMYLACPLVSARVRNVGAFNTHEYSHGALAEVLGGHPAGFDPAADGARADAVALCVFLDREPVSRLQRLFTSPAGGCLDERSSLL